MARAGGGGSSGGRGFGNSGGRSFGGRSGSSSGGGSFKRGGVSGGGGARPGSSAPRPGRGGAGYGGLGGGFGGYGGLGGGYGGGYNYGRPGYGPGVPPPPPPRRRRRGYYGPGYYGGGCFTMALVLITVVIFSAVMVLGAPLAGTTAGANSSGSIGKSTVEREKLPAGAVNETGYYTDELGWISNSSLLLDGMEHFYNETGVQPYLYLTDNIDGDHAPNGAAAQGFANELYEELFTDEGHFLLIFQEYNGQYNMWYLAGNAAKAVMDTEASNILLDYVEKYYYDSSLSDEQCFSKAFSDTGDRIMSVTRSPWIPVLLIAGIVVLLAILFFWWRGAKRQREIEDHRTAEILNTPLETYGGSQVEELEEKYRNK